MSNRIFFIKTISLVLITIFLYPIIDFKNFYLLIFLMTILIFSEAKVKLPYFKTITIIIIIFFLKFFQSNLYFHEGNNILILNNKSKNFYQNNLPENFFNFLDQEFKFYEQNSKCSSDNEKCWRFFDPSFLSKKGSPFYAKYSPSMNLDISEVKYSRKIKDLSINNIKSARISEINNLRYNYFWGDKFDLVRENIPFYVKIEISKILLNSQLCWKGNIFWEGKNFSYNHIKHDAYKCKKITENDINKKIYGVGLGKSGSYDYLNWLYGDNYIKENDKLDTFLNKNELILKLDKSVVLQVLDFTLFFFIFIASIIFINLLLKYNFKIYFYSILSTLLFLFLTYYSSQDLFFGFTIYTGGNDGLVYSSYANNMFHYLKEFKIAKFLMGVEGVFYFPSSLRYFLTLFKFVFADTTYGYLTIGYILCLIITFLFIKLYGQLAGLIFAFLVIFTRVFEGYAASMVKLLKHINAGDAEPFAITLFFICLYLFIFIKENKNQDLNLMNFIFGFLSFITISLRPNYLPTSLLLFLIHIYFLNYKKTKKPIIFSTFGFCFILLIPLHNLYFGKTLVFLSSGYQHNTGASLSTYFSGILDIIQLNFYQSENIEKIIHQFNRWISPNELHYIIVIFLLLLIFRFKNNYMRIISSLAFSQHAVLLVFEPTGRYSYLAWFLSLIVVMYFLKILIELIISKIKINRKYT